MPKMKRLSKANRATAEQLLGEARVAQTMLWDALNELEGLLDVEISASIDLEGYDLDMLRKGQGAE